MWQLSKLLRGRLKDEGVETLESVDDRCTLEELAYIIGVRAA